jgi:hypothetical protein
MYIYPVEAFYTGSSLGNRCAIARVISEMILRSLWSYQLQKGEDVLLLLHGVLKSDSG